jgi:hypothetical protein
MIASAFVRAAILPNERQYARRHHAEAMDACEIENSRGTRPWVMGYMPSQFGTYWKYLDIDLARHGMRP